MTNKNKYGRVHKNDKWYRLRSNGSPSVELLYADHTMTKAELMSRILSFARRGTKFWPPAMALKLSRRRKYIGDNKLQKWEYQCMSCNMWYPDKQVHLDHIVPLGGINDWDKIVNWYRRAYVDMDGYQLLCKVSCHQIKTNKERHV